MKFKSTYKSCFWSKTDIWGCLINKKKSFLRNKWDKILLMVLSQNKRRRQNLCKNYILYKPQSRPNKILKFRRWFFKSALINKVCLRRFYGDLNRRVLSRLCFESKTPEILLKKLEKRLDINLYRLGFFTSIFAAKQAILHGKVFVNGSKTTNTNFILKYGDYVEFCPKYRNYLRLYMVSYNNVPRTPARLKLPPTPNWIQTDYPNLSFVICDVPDTSLFFPFRVEFDDVLNSFKYS